ncbi:MAG: hypothetical protein LBU67_09375, partial [Oscillospiraceae bacterium]|nr:hypothetical protein [Oscillospiraceae bacterium]
MNTECHNELYLRGKTLRYLFVALAAALALACWLAPAPALATEAGSIRIQAASAGLNQVPYLDEHGETQYADGVTEITSADDIVDNTLTSGWYLVSSYVTLSDSLIISGDVHLILKTYCTLMSNDGIDVSDSNSLTIYAEPLSYSYAYQGSINAKSSMSAPGIGNKLGSACGNITINGGTITATGGAGGAGIGGGNGGAGGTVTINGGTVTATGGDGGAGIGGGNGGAGGTVTISGGSVTATATDGAGIGGGRGGAGAVLNIDGNVVVVASSVSDASAKAKGILFNGNTGTVYGNVTLPGSFTISGDQTLTVPNGAALTVPNGKTLTNRGTVIPADGSTLTLIGTLSGNRINGANVSGAPVADTPAGGNITVSAVTLAAATGQTVEYAVAASPEAAPDTGWQTGTTFIGLTAGETYYIFARSKVADQFATGATAQVSAAIVAQACPELVDGVAYLDEHGATQYAAGVKVIASADDITANTLVNGWYLVNGSFTLANRLMASGDVHLILGDGFTLTANAGIAVNGADSLAIYTQSANKGTMGALTAFAGISDVATIGGDKNNQGGSITINGGIITIYAVGYGTGIGGGQNGGSGNITINGGSVTVQGESAGIGPGKSGAGGSITINGGTVTASSNAIAGIGGRQTSITINGGTVTATGNSASCVGIGGYNANIFITGGTVTANSSGKIGLGNANFTSVLTLNGNAAVFTKSSYLSYASTKTRGILFDGTLGTVYGTVTLPGNITVPSGTALFIPNGASLTVATLTNNGTVIPMNGSAMTVNGVVTGNPINGANMNGAPIAGTPAGGAMTASAATLAAATGQSVEYGYSAAGGTQTTAWQDDPTFTGLVEGQTYYIFARSKANSNFAAGAAQGMLLNHVPYLDEHGETRYADGVKALASAVDNTATLWTGWYLMSGDFNPAKGLIIKGDVRLILEDGCALTTNNGGIIVNYADSLTIYAQSADRGTMGALQATSTSAAAIGADSEASGNITINGGAVTATSSGDGAGIGGASNSGMGGNITINGGVITATGKGYGAGIGGGYGGTGGNITINGGTVTATNTSGAAGIGAGASGDGGNITINGGTITATGSEGAGIGGGSYSGAGTIRINGGAITATSNNGTGIGCGSWAEESEGSIIINGGVVTSTGNSYYYITDEFYTYYSEGYAGLGGGHTTLAMNGNAVVFTNEASDTSAKTRGILFNGDTGTVYGDVVLPGNITIPSGKTLTVPSGASLTVPGGKTLILGGAAVNNGTVIPADGSTVTVTGTLSGNLITGANVSGSAVKSTPSGGVITVNAATLAAATGQNVEYGYSAASGTQPAAWQDEPTFTGLVEGQIYYIFARSKANSNFAAGAVQATSVLNHVPYLDEHGETRYADDVQALTTADDITANTLSAGWYLVNGSFTFANRLAASGDVHLILGDGFTLTASLGIKVAGADSLAIYAQSADQGTMGALTAQGQGENAGIGGDNGDGGSITINGGAITATGGRWGAGIGGGDSGAGGDITINGGTVTATAANGAGIGGGEDGAGGTVTISGGSVTATATYGAGIGVGRGGAGAVLNIDGNAVVVASSVSDASAKTRGILFNGNAGTVYGNVTLPGSLDIAGDQTLTVSSGASLTVPGGKTLTNSGTVIPADGSTVTVTGTLSGNLITGANVSGAPTASVTTKDSITVNAVTLAATTGQTVEYGYSAASGTQPDAWQDAATFTGLTEGETYYIFARSKADANFAAGAATVSQAIVAGAYTAPPSLDDLIEETEKALQDAVNDGQHTQDEIDDLTDALNDAKTVANDPSASQQQRDDAAKNLQDALDAFNNGGSGSGSGDGSGSGSGDGSGSGSGDGSGDGSGSGTTVPDLDDLIEETEKALQDAVNDGQHTQDEIDDLTDALN